MKLGVSTDWGVSNAKEWIEKNTSLGLESVVFPLDSNADDKKIDEYCKAAQEAGITIAEVGIWRNAIDADRDTANANLEYSIKQLALADKISAKCCVNVAGAFSGSRWDGPHRDNYSKEAWNKTVKMVQKVIDEVNPKHTYFTIEAMPWMIPSSPKEYLNLIEDVARDRFAVHMDIINMTNCPERYFFPEEFLEECFDLLKGQIKSCHLKDILLLQDYTFMLKECACGEGTYPIEKYAELATREDPDMPMIIEHLGSNEAYRDSVLYVKERLGK